MRVEKIDFNSEEWKEKLKDKSPEEIAEIVASYYEEKYKELSPFSWKKIAVFIIFLIILIIIFVILLSFLRKLAF